jgi:tight adherence protein B
MRVDRLRSALDRAGLDEVSTGRFLGSVAVAGALGMTVTAAAFGPGLPCLLVGAAAATLPVAAWRRRRATVARSAREAWPRLVEELRVLTAAAGRPIPQALLEVGLRGPDPLRPAFRAAQREWAVSTDFERTVAVLKDRLGHEHLRRLAEDRRRDLRDRREAEAKQAGARLARAFVILVPAGMAMAGLNVGDGRAAFRTAWGQAVVVAGIALVGACWWWSSRILRLPEPDRVFDR